MALSEDRSASFIVHVWFEPRGRPTAPALWRGSIEHVETGRRDYVLSLDGIAGFIAGRLAELEMPPHES